MTAPATAQRGMTRKQRTTIIRTAQYAVIVLIVVVMALVGHWHDFKVQFLDWHVMGQILPRIIKTGFVNTLIYTASAFVFGLIVGLIIALMRMSEVRLYRWIATVYVELLRGLPTLLVLYLLTYGIPIVFGNNNKFFGNFYVLVTLGLGSVAAAYMSETIRAGVQAVPKGQMEAARTLGMSRGSAMRLVILPQAFRIIIPPLTNEVILLIKDSSLVFAVGLASSQYELTFLANTAASGGITGIDSSSSPLILAGLAYLVITLPLSQAVRALERNQAKRR
ncbi:polar amino acid transport system permease protein [Nakamurella panacisegetis]|uniref:Polar amino acid transport system permease protein n=1 Tax=Nakamurella panacisegetis TaxID=1090615 RepID=A0A1H0IB87_9ACTN|nr:amino acid ABC transporter permease [Nakamurella panacisegetis]SDO28662.1 polar amino acid transport system permease protein [Nakamurella panacisegetis]